MLKISSMKKVVLFALIMFSAVLFAAAACAAKGAHAGPLNSGLLLMGFGQPSSALMKALFLGQLKKILGLKRRVFLVV